MSTHAVPTPLHKPEPAFVPIDPQTAARWLKRNTKNRKLRRSDVDAYARDMLAGNWQMTGEAIKFAPDGTLLDGQHRLAAIVKSGVTVTLLVIRNVPATAQAAMDSGTKRTAADMLTLAEHKNATMLAAAARLAIQVERGDLGNNWAPTHAEVATYIDNNPGLVRAVELARAVARRVDCTPATVAYTWYVLAKIDPFEAANFWGSAADKVGLRAGDPVIALTNRFAEARRNRQPLTRTMQISAVYRAWNARRDGKSMRLVKIMSPSGGPIPIPVPR
jgi:hypothetical protein